MYLEPIPKARHKTVVMAASFTMLANTHAKAEAEYHGSFSTKLVNLSKFHVHQYPAFLSPDIIVLCIKCAIIKGPSKSCHGV